MSPICLCVRQEARNCQLCLTLTPKGRRRGAFCGWKHNLEWLTLSHTGVRFWSIQPLEARLGTSEYAKKSWEDRGQAGPDRFRAEATCWHMYCTNALRDRKDAVARR